jgi:hypothetical protein
MVNFIMENNHFKNLNDLAKHIEKNNHVIDDTLFDELSAFQIIDENEIKPLTINYTEEVKPYDKSIILEFLKNSEIIKE